MSLNRFNKLVTILRPTLERDAHFAAGEARPRGAQIVFDRDGRRVDHGREEFSNVVLVYQDPLDQIHEGPDAGAPTEVNEAGDASSVAGQAGTERGKGGVGWEAGQAVKPPKPEVLYLEKTVPLRDSIMWELQRMYYTAHHVQCWEKMVVPCFVTSNSFIARAYARVLVGFMRDWFLFSDQANQSEPILILEIGSGHGKFACLVLQHILDMREFLPTLRGCSNGITSEPSREGVPLPPSSDTPGPCELPSGGDGTEESNRTVGAENGTSGGDRYENLPFRYIVTDVAQGTLDYVRSHASMQKFLEAGVLDLAILDAEDATPSNELHLQVSDVVVDLKARENPMAAVCNYVFDSLRQDAFRVKEKTLYENRVSITAARPLPDDLSQLSLNALQGLGLQWDHNPYVVSPERAKAFYAGLETEDQKKANGNALKGIGGADESDGAARDAPPSEGCSTGEGELDQGDVASSVTESEPNTPESIGEGASMGATGTTEEAGAGTGNGDSNGEGKGSEGNSGPGGVASSGDSDFDELLASYLEGSFGEAGGSLLVPLGGLRLLRRLASLARGRCLVLAGDKGYVDEEEMSGQRDPHIAYHGSLSCMVNLDALARYTRQRGGWALSSPYMEGFKCQALAFGMGEEALEETRLAFEAATQEFGPESFSTLQRAIKDEVAAPSLSLATQLLRLSQLDPDVFMKFRMSLVQQVSNYDLSPPVWEDLKNDVVAIAEKWFPLQQGKDVNFEVARLLMALKDFESALELFRRSDRICGEHNVTCHNMGMSYFYLGRLPEAKECFERSLALDGTYQDSMQWLAHVNRNMEPPSSAEEDLSADNAAGRRTGSEPVAGSDCPEAGTVDVNQQ